MQRTQLGRTGIEVSAYCLGTMTYGTNTTEAEAHQQLDLSLDHGIDFLDTAEMYPVNPVKKETVGLTEEIIGRWNTRSGRRREYVVATKCTGVNGSFVREDQIVNGKTLRSACESSLRRLQTDYIDLYQLHWPNRGSYHFRQIWEYNPSKQDRASTIDHMGDVMTTLKALVDEGKIRAFGLSNESTWGTDQWLQSGERTGGPRIASIQNEYSVLCRMPFGFVTGKYLNGALPEGSRMQISGDSPRLSARLDVAVKAFIEVASKHSIDPVHMALAFCLQRPFPCIPIFGATKLAQLEHVLAGKEIKLTEEALTDLNKINRDHPMPF